MTKTIKHLILGTMIVLSLSTIVLLAVKLRVVITSQLIVAKDDTTIIASPNLHKYLQNEQVKKCSIVINDVVYQGYLFYQSYSNDHPLYWATFDKLLPIDNGTQIINIDFGQLLMIKYIYYFCLN